MADCEGCDMGLHVCRDCKNDKLPSNDPICKMCIDGNCQFEENSSQGV